VHPLVGKVKDTLAKHHDKLWWAHSIYALGLGVAVVILAHRKFHLVKWLILFLFFLWMGLLVYQRFLIGDEGASRTRKGLKVAVNYIMKNLYQQMYFFMIPFYYDTTTFGSANMWFLAVIAVCAVLSTQDIVFDRYLMENKYYASLFYAFCIFASFNLFLPLLTGMRNVTALYTAGLLTVVTFVSLHFRARQIFNREGAVALAIATGLFLTMLRWGRTTIPPAPLRQVSSAMAVGVDARGTGPAGQFYRIHVDDLSGTTLHCFTSIETPLRVSEDIQHVWKLRGKVVHRQTFATVHSRSEKGIPLHSTLSSFPGDPVGRWIVEAKTTGGQLIGETRFLVVR
jgi:hypothetical protein